MNLMAPDEIQKLVTDLCANGRETEWVEFKLNNENPDEIGQYISALSNSAALHSRSRGYIIWGIDDKSLEVVGTKFKPKKQKVGNQELESWLLNHLTPSIEVCFHEGSVDDKPIVVFEIQAAFSHPVRFKGIEYIRVGSYNKGLREYGEKERKLWDIFRNEPFEKGIARENLSGDQILLEIDYSAYFQLVDQPIPDNPASIINRLKAEGIVKETVSGKFAITNIGGILFANNLEQLGRLGRKALRVIVYKGTNRVHGVNMLVLSGSRAVK